MESVVENVVVVSLDFEIRRTERFLAGLEAEELRLFDELTRVRDAISTQRQILRDLQSDVPSRADDGLYDTGDDNWDSVTVPTFLSADCSDAEAKAAVLNALAYTSGNATEAGRLIGRQYIHMARMMKTFGIPAVPRKGRRRQDMPVVTSTAA